MSDFDFETRIKAMDNKQLEARYARAMLNCDLGVAMAKRLLELFEDRSMQSQQDWPTFEQWLRTQLGYTSNSGFNIFEKDEVLKKLLSYGLDRPKVVVALNDFLRAYGFRSGVSQQLNNIQMI